MSDTVAFTRCTTSMSDFRFIDDGIAAGKRIDLEGTPTVLVNGWRYFSPPSVDELTRVVGQLLSGKDPFDAHETH